jgi:hypothetical protein
MTKLARAATVLVTVVAVVACAACTGDAGSSIAAGSTGSSTPASSARSSAAGDVPPPPEVGQCRNTPANDSWVDNTPVVDCSKPHTLETVSVIKPIEKLTLARAKQLAPSCESPAVDYLGIGSREVRTTIIPVFWPSRAQRAAGQNWVRCDVAVSPTTGCCRRLAPQTGSLRDAVSSDPLRFRVCINQVPDPPGAQPLTSCEKPHRAEVLAAPLQLSVTHYPSAAALAKKGRVGCARLIAHRKDRESLVVTPDWHSRANWSGGTLYGRCWIHRKTGLMPAIK